MYTHTFAVRYLELLQVHTGRAVNKHRIGDDSFSYLFALECKDFPSLDTRLVPIWARTFNLSLLYRGTHNLKRFVTCAISFRAESETQKLQQIEAGKSRLSARNKEKALCSRLEPEANKNAVKRSTNRRKPLRTAWRK